MTICSIIHFSPSPHLIPRPPKHHNLYNTFLQPGSNVPQKTSDIHRKINLSKIYIGEKMLQSLTKKNLKDRKCKQYAFFLYQLISVAVEYPRND